MTMYRDPGAHDHTTCQEVMGAGGSMGDIGKKISEEWNALGNSFARSGYAEFPKHIEIILNASELWRNPAWRFDSICLAVVCGAVGST